MNKPEPDNYNHDSDFSDNRARFLKYASLIGSLAALVMAAISLNDTTFVFTVICFFFAGFLALIFWLVNQNKVDIHRLMLAIAVIIFSIHCYSAFYTLHVSIGLVWYMAYPLVYLFLLGEKMGLRVTLTVIVVTIIAYLSYPLIHGFIAQPAETLYSLIAAYLVVTFLSWFHTSQLYAYQSLLFERANVDALTAAMSRSYGTSLIENMIELSNRRKEDRFSLVMLDLDNFKRVNDEYGHDMGDKVLKSMVHGIRKKLRKSDTLIRWGGEEFIILLPNTVNEDAVFIAEVICKALPDYTEQDTGLRVTASFGIASHLQNEELRQIVSRADVAMYKAKKTGKNRVVLHQPDSVTS